MTIPVHLNPEKSGWPVLLKRPGLNHKSIEASVMEILDEVRMNGDEAVIKFSRMFDKVILNELAVTSQEIDESESLLTDELKAAMRQAKHNIERFHSAQLTQEVEMETMPGIRCWRKSVAIEKVGLYIPGGTAPLFSTVLMLGVPAAIAGCKQIIICSPPNKEGKLHPAILYAAKLVGITTIFKVGGAQAIGAMAYGTQTIRKVYKIFGPGNQYVTCAKQFVQKDGVAIDMPAGPSEVAVLADDTANPAFVAADLLSQAEHGVDSQVVLVTTSQKVAEDVQAEVTAQLEHLSRKNISGTALQNSVVIVLNDIDEAVDLINEYAPEHLIIACRNDEAIGNRIINAGSVFLGNYSPESAGDYASGTNHTLPTNGYAKAYSGVSTDSFVKKITYQKLTKQGCKNIASTVEAMALAEGLHAHAYAIKVRSEDVNVE